MNFLQSRIQEISTWQLMLLTVLLSIPAFLLNLGDVAFIGDEAIRSLVAFEMDKSGDFLVPTLNGVEYYNKPPLYNWLIYANSKLFGFFGEWPARTTTLLFLALFGYTVFHFARKHFDFLTSSTLAIMLLTSGRILFWDSMLGLIDICFSWVIFLSWMMMYHFGKAKKWYMFFITSWILFAAAFLLKGLPAVVFHGLSLVSTLLFLKDFKKIFSPAHFAGVLIGIGCLLAYYIPYAKVVAIENVVAILFDQSMQRTATHHGLMKTTLHLFTFPFEQLYHFLPWSLLLLLFLLRGFTTQLRSNDFVRFQFWMLIANIPVYWISVQVYPRYLLMFLPLIHCIGYYLYQQYSFQKNIFYSVFKWIFSSLAIIVLMGIVLLPFLEKTRSLPQIWIITVAGMISIGACLLMLLTDRRRLFLWMGIALLIARIFFNLVVLPLRAQEFTENKSREDAARMAAAHGDKKWIIYGETETHQVARFYTSVYSDQQILKSDQISDVNAYYLVDLEMYPAFPGNKVDSLILERGQIIYLMSPNQQ